MNNQINELVEKINQADAIVIGAGSGMSNAAGMNFWYEASPLFLKYMKYYYDKYHFKGLFNGWYNKYDSENERWAYSAISNQMMNEIPPQKPTYEYLQKILNDKTFHIVTTNQDGIFKRFFPEEKISEIQGSVFYLQSSNPETDKKLYDANKIYAELRTKIVDHKVPDEYIPRSDVDGAVLTPWWRSPEFLEDKRYYEEYEKLNVFLKQHQDEKVLFLEMGVGRMTPMFIQEPFWQLTGYFKDAQYVNINPKDAVTNPAIKDKSLLIKDDINEVLKETAEQMEEK